MRFAFLGSGSRGNAVLFEHGGTRLLVDCGFPRSELERRLARLDVAPESLAAVLVTHEHGDHLRGAAAFACRHRLPVWLTPGTFAAWRPRRMPEFELFSPHEAFALGDLEIVPYPVPHDAREPCQLVVSDGARRVAMLSDLGRITPHVRDTVTGCDALLLECNHDADMLAAGPYPASLKRRVAGGQGHLDNAQAAALLSDLDTSGLQHVIAVHLSEKNNTTDLALAALAGALGCARNWIGVADQEEGLSWRAIAAL